MFDRLSTTKQDSQITNAMLRGEALGDDTFHQKISKLISRPTKLTAHGGDRKSETYYQADCLLYTRVVSPIYVLLRKLVMVL